MLINMPGIRNIESADAYDIAPEKFIASILEDIMSKEIREEEAV